MVGAKWKGSKIATRIKERTKVEYARNGSEREKNYAKNGHQMNKK